jgi:S-adenosylmethionine:tRNA ribosyltransferase-isomerase
MHSEHFFINKKTIEIILEHHGKNIAVGTTSVRALESIYWLGVRLLKNPADNFPGFSLGQWDAYRMKTDFSVEQSLGALLKFLNERNLSYLHASTSIMIVPGYEFRMTVGMITNFHQPRSTLLLLISAWTGNRWKDIYTFALKNRFRFLSYGDSSLLLR